MERTNNRFLNILITISVAICLVASFVVFSNAASANSGTGYINEKEGVNVRSGPSTSSSKVTALSDNTKVTILSEHFTSSSTSSTSIWYKIKTGSKTGYVRSDLMDGISYSAVSAKTTDALNYRNGPSTSHSWIGTLDNGKSILVYMTAYGKGSSVPWYKVKINSKYYYVCGSYVSIGGSIFDDTTGGGSTGGNTGGSTGGGSTGGGSTGGGSTGGGTTTAPSFEQQLAAFPESYKPMLRELHNQHPNWVFVADNTGLDFNTVIARQSKNGVSLIEGSWPISWRATDANSFKPNGDMVIYSKPGSGSTGKKLSNKESFKLLSETWVGKTQWNYIQTTAGTKGYVKGSLHTQEYPVKMTGIVNDDYISVRDGGSTSNTWLTQYNKGTKVEVVLRVSDGTNYWYKIKYKSGYAYMFAEYVTIQAGSAVGTIETDKEQFNPKYGVAEVTAETEYRALCDKDFPVLGTIGKGSKHPILGSYKDSAAKTWYKLYLDGKEVFVEATNITASGKITNLSKPSLDANTVVQMLADPSDTAAEVDVVRSDKVVKVTGLVKKDGKDWFVIDSNGVDAYLKAKNIEYTVPAAPADAKPQIGDGTMPAPPSTTVSQLTGKASIINGTYIPKDGSNWFNADPKVVEYFIDPRNFLTNDRIYMFEDLSFHGYQTEAVVNKVLSGTALSSNGFLAKWFYDAGSKHGMSPVALAARARQETGGGSIAISGYVMNGKTVYNPFNIGAYSDANPVMRGLEYAYNQGWYTKQASVEGGAKFLASGYINAGQNSVYYQKFNVSNGSSAVGTHQYMTNIRAPYDESITTKNTYGSFGITNEALTFVIPVFNNMPASTSLPG